MGKSYRKNPICGITCTESEKQDKRLCNRKLRRNNKRKIAPLDEEDIEGLIFDTKDDAMNIWAMGKDGKQRVDPVEHPGVLRK
jgi:hypothetical protein